tara:strand:+ start:299 stop:820 length:522 start_codon:yes stop_codon:yes gene_type:complete
MATRNVTMVVDRKHAEEHSEGFAADPCVYTDNSYVNMYLHHDGYPEWQGVQLANWVHSNARQDGSALAAKLVHDHYYDSCYLYADHQHIDHNYTYIIWTGDKDDIWISCWNQYSSTCVFVLKPEKIISKYINEVRPMEYTDFANGATRYEGGIADDVKYHSKRLIDILTGFTD